ncbi:MAG TPA: PorT family protein [Bacteroidales bacterium]|nr:PorT family protein [Bacteroidales bacterium]
MKHFILALIISFISITSLYSQKKVFDNELYIGVGGGAYASSVDFVPSIPQNQKIDFFGGVSAKYITQNHLGLIIEANYSRRGWEEEYDSESDFSYSRTLNYLEVPFMTHIYFGDKARFIINVGPQISFLLNDKQSMSSALASDVEARQAIDPDAPIGVQYSPFSELNRFDYGIVGGVGMTLQTGIGNFDLEGRYYFGLGDVFESRRSKNSYFGRSAHRLIEAKLTYYIKAR